MSQFEVKDHHGAPTLFMDGDPTFTTIYLTVRNRNMHIDGWQGDPYFEQFRDAGFHFYSIELPTGFDDAYDAATSSMKYAAFERLDVLKRYAELDPQAKFLLRVGIEPRGEQSAWIKQHTDECEALETRARPVYAVLRLRTDTPSAASFNEALGYVHTTEPSATHRRTLG